VPSHHSDRPRARTLAALERPTPLVLALTATLLTAGCRLASSPASGPPPAEPTARATARVTRVTDGDTFHAVVAGAPETVRMIGVDAPEVDWYGGRGECFGPEAGHYAQDQLEGRLVGLAFDVDHRDRYGRLLAYVTLGPELFNMTLLEEGYAVTLEVLPNTSRANAFRAAEATARDRRAGLWEACPSSSG
jgi:endonuclease YncB( thermonuclease family)